MLNVPRDLAERHYADLSSKGFFGSKCSGACMQRVCARPCLLPWLARGAAHLLARAPPCHQLTLPSPLPLLLQA